MSERWTTRRARWAGTLAAVAAAAACGVPAASAAGGAAAGVYVGAASPADASAFAKWSGEHITYVVEFPDRQLWSGIESPWFIPHVWSSAAATYRHDVLVLSVPMLPGNTGTLEAGAAGTYDTHFRRLAQHLADAGLASRTVIRLGWEFNSGWARWSAAKDPAAYRSYFRRVVTTMRAVAPHLRFDWCPAQGDDEFSGIPGGLAAAYPGDAYVNMIGLDVYDQAWGVDGAPVADPAVRWQQLVTNPGGLAWQAAFAAAHHKPLSYPEWGLTQRKDGHGGGDDPTFITNMHAWIASHNVAYQSYFDLDTSDGLHALGTKTFPLASAAFRRLFGGTGA
jgi:glycosyl hydrolase family 26